MRQSNAGRCQHEDFAAKVEVDRLAEATEYDPLAMYDELVQIAAMAARAHHDVIAPLLAGPGERLGQKGAAVIQGPPEGWASSAMVARATGMPGWQWSASGRNGMTMGHADTEAEAWEKAREAQRQLNFDMRPRGIG